MRISPFIHRCSRAAWRRVVWTLGAMLVASVVQAAPRLTSAVADVRFASPLACEVALAVTTDQASDVQHRIEVLPGSRVELVGVEGATTMGAPTDIGVTRALVVTSSAKPYTVRYRVDLAPDRPHRCPMWLPSVPADGRSRNVRLHVTLPDGAAAAGTMPAFAWTGSHGEAVVGHLPAFVLVPFAAAGMPRPWDVSRVMDATAVATLALASVLWLARARSRRGRATDARAEAHG